MTVEAAAPPSSVQASSTYVALAAVVAATSGLLFGFDIAVINGAIIFLRAQFGLTEFQTEMAASSLLIGCVFGASCGGWLSDRFGRRRILMLSAVLFAMSSAGAALPRNLAEFMSARFVGGLAIGMASLLAPLYIAEVAPARNRGRLVSLNQMAIVTGILLAYLVNWYLSFAGPESWRWMFLVAGVPSIAFLAALFFVPESPRWLVERGRRQEALAVLTRINGSVAGRLLLSEIEGAIGEASQPLRELFASPLRRRLALAVALAVLSQITGINTVLFYGSIIFREHVGSSGSSALAVNVAVGLVNLVATLFALWAIDRLGRRPLLMISSGVMALCQGALGATFLTPSTSGGFGVVDHARVCGRFRDRAGTGRVGSAVRDFPHAGPWPRHVRCNREPVDRLYDADIDVPIACHRADTGGRVLDLRRHVRPDVSHCPFRDARDQGENLGGDRGASRSVISGGRSAMHSLKAA